jgi:Tfp pilus assembly protein PilF
MGRDFRASRGLMLHNNRLIFRQFGTMPGKHMDGTSRHRRWLLLCLLTCVSLFAADEDIWTEIQSPHFTVISNASPKQARRAARSLEQFRQLIRTAMPRLKADPPAPLKVFALKDGKSLKSILPIRPENGAVEPSGLFMKSAETQFVALRLDVPEEQAYRTIYHEYVHMVTRLNFQRMPLWLAEGLADFYATATLSDKGSTLGNVRPEALQTLEKYSMIPLPVLMTATNDSPYYQQADKARTFYAQSWALTHYLLLGDKAEHASQLNEYLLQIQNGASEREAARALGDIDLLERNLRRYAKAGSYYHYQIPAHLEVKEEEYAARSLSQAESLALRGQFLIGSERLTEAKTMLEEALRLDPKSAEAQEGMGMLLLAFGNQEKAGEYFTAAARLNSKSYMAYFHAAQSESQNARDFRAAEGHLRKALELNPKFVPALSLLAQIVSLRKENRPEALKLMEQAASLEPAEIRHRLNQCEILLQMERFDEATRLAESALTIAGTDADRKLATAELARIRERQQWVQDVKRREEAEAERDRERAKELEDFRNQRALIEQQQQAEASKPARATVPPIKRGRAGRTIGVIKSVKCHAPAVMDVVLEMDGKQKTYRAEDYYRVQYWAVASQGKTGFQPCTGLDGKRVQIEFQSVVGQDFSGFIQTVTIIK